MSDPPKSALPFVLSALAAPRLPDPSYPHHTQVRLSLLLLTVRTLSLKNDRTVLSATHSLTLSKIVGKQIGL